MSKRLGFRLPALRRLAWVSEPAQVLWQPRFRAAACAWSHVELQSVLQGKRDCGLIYVRDTHVDTIAALCSAKGFGVYQIDSGTCASEKRVVVCRPAQFNPFMNAYRGEDHWTLGRLLGYPECCRAAFIEWWSHARLDDPASYIVSPPRNPAGQRAAIVPAANILLRVLGIRLTAHLPCSLSCPNTGTSSTTQFALAESPQHQAGLDIAHEVLSWPLRWSAAKGIAEITTPVCKIVHDTDAVAGHIRVDVEGTVLPIDTAVGAHFPFVSPTLKNAPARWRAQLNTKRDGRNGFTTSWHMQAAHEALCIALRDVLRSVHEGRIVDLGCGDGSLLARLCAESPIRLEPVGLDNNAAVLNCAVERGNCTRTLTILANAQDIHSWMALGPYSLGVCSAERLIELEMPARCKLIDALSEACNFHVIYSYGKTLAELPLTTIFNGSHAANRMNEDEYVAVFKSAS